MMQAREPEDHQGISCPGLGEWPMSRAGAASFSGVQSVDAALILSGALPAAALAIAVDAILGLVERRLRPRGV